MSISHLLNQKVTIERWTRQRDDTDFTVKPNWTEVATDVAFAVQEKTGTISRTEAGNRIRFDAVGYCDPLVDIRPRAAENAEGDRIRVSSTGAQFYVRGVVDQTGHGLFKKVFLEAV